MIVNIKNITNIKQHLYGEHKAAASTRAAIYPITHRIRKLFICLFEFSCSVLRDVTHLSCDGAEHSNRLFGQNKPFLSSFIYVYVCFVGNVALSV